MALAKLMWHSGSRLQCCIAEQDSG